MTSGRQRLERQLAHATLREGCWAALRAREPFAFASLEGVTIVQPIPGPPPSWITATGLRLPTADVERLLRQAVAYLPEPP